MPRIRRQFGDWQLYTSHPVTLGCDPEHNGFVYHVPLAECQTVAGYEDWVRQISEKAGFDLDGFKQAIKILRAEGKYLKPI